MSRDAGYDQTDRLVDSLEAVTGMCRHAAPDDPFWGAAEAVAAQARAILDGAESSAKRLREQLADLEAKVRSMKADGFYEEALAPQATGVLVEALKCEATLRESEATLLGRAAENMQVRTALEALEAVLAGREAKGGDE